MAAGDVRLSDPVDVFEFGPRVRNALRREHITTVGELLACDRHQLLYVRSFGPTMLDEVVQTLAKHGLELKPTPPPPTPEQRRQLLAEMARQAVDGGFYDKPAVC